MIREKYNLVQELQKKNLELVGKKKLALVGQGDFTGGNNVMRGSMNIKHHSQHLTIDNPEFPFIYDGKENVTGKYSSFYAEADKDYEVIEVCKKYEQLLNGKCYIALYFLHCRDDDSYKVVYRKEVEDLTENFGFKFSGDPKKDPMVVNEKELKVLQDGFKKNKLPNAARIVMAGKAGIGWTSGSHTALPVLTTSQGVGAELFKGFIENSDIARKIKTLL